MSFGTFSLADIAGKAQEAQLRRQQMEMQQRRMDFDERKYLADLDKDKREQVDAALKDLSAAVQWAKTPEQWAVVQQHYGQYDPQLAAVPFEQREQAIVRLGQMSEYLKGTQEKFQSIEAGGSLYGIKPDGSVREVVRANPGDQQFGTPAGKSVVRTGKDASGRQVVQYSDGSIEYAGGGTGNGVGGF